MDADRSTEPNADLPEAIETRVAAHQPLPRNVKVLGGASLLNDIASEMIYPLMPQFLLTVLGGNRFYLGIIEGLAESISSLLKLWSGALSDRAGQRKGFVLFGYSLAAVARPLIGVATAPWHMLAARTADRVGKGLRTSPRDALIADSTPPGQRGRAFGFHRAMDHLGAAIGPVLATGFLLLWPGELRILFLLTIVPGLAVVALLAVGLREKASELAAPEPVAGPRKRLDRNFQLYMASLIVFTLGNSSDAFLLVRAGELGVPTALLPLLWCAFHLVKSSGNLLVGRAVDRLGARPLIIGGWIFYAGVYLAFAAVSNAWQVTAVFLAYGLFYALTEPAEKTFVTSLVGETGKGLAYGWFNFAIGIATLPASLIFGWLYEQYGSPVAFGWGAGLAIVAALLLTGAASPPAANAKPAVSKE
ncbi:MFS transporter [Blastopirellula marina]|uniref:MFS transporter n=1 Tax=Blastopirellula marina TaxID=124 RepID=A0A2S8G6Z6_9BACT|nr:MFS transporter [Blastopirellula marina]PQO40209.1 MFS transporter [Blastopirellula marina]PTL45576.1 MFS transporter [Blastopirellula marina]